MISHQTKKILVAVDGSEYSKAVIRYICYFKPFHHWKVVLFHIFNDIPEPYLDLEMSDPMFFRTMQESRMWETNQKDKIRTFMQNSTRNLIEAGFDPEKVSSKTVNRKNGISRDIIEESNKGYDAIVIGRKGTGLLKEIVVGSVAFKLLNLLTSVPILIIGMLPPNNKMLIAFDGSENAFKAVGFVADSVGGFDLEIHLTLVIRGNPEAQFTVPMLYLPKEHFEHIKIKIKNNFDEAKKLLIKSGFKKDCISSFVHTTASSRSSTIIHEARNGDYGTIVLGRKGLSRIEEFLMGRVTNKVISLIRNRAVWIIP
ncbi:MAG: universal stress protein [Desulfobacterales bacterium]|nr:universal stress protein [Desulfobacterales bacterium]